MIALFSSLFFAIVLAIGIGVFVRNAKKIRRNILLGQPLDRSDNPSARWKNMVLIALGQSKMVKRPVAGFFHHQYRSFRNHHRWFAGNSPGFFGFG